MPGIARRLVSLSWMALLPCLAGAQPLADRPIRLIVPVAPGGPLDEIARLVAPALGRDLGVPIVVENRPGAGGAVGAAELLRSPADGRTLLMLSAGVAHGADLKSEGRWLDRLSLAGVVSRSPYVLVARPDGRLGSIDKTRQPGPRITLAAPAQPSLSFSNAAVLSRASPAPIEVDDQYRGLGTALDDIAKAKSDGMLAPLSQVLEPIRAGRLQPLATTARSPLLPQVPTFAEAGLPGDYLDDWTALVGPPGMPQPVTDHLAAALARALAGLPRETAVAAGLLPRPEDRRAFEALLSRTGDFQSTGGGRDPTCPKDQCYCRGRRECKTGSCESGC